MSTCCRHRAEEKSCCHPADGPHPLLRAPAIKPPCVLVVKESAVTIETRELAITKARSMNPGRLSRPFRILEIGGS